jgi:hypothetical protein
MQKKGTCTRYERGSERRRPIESWLVVGLFFFFFLFLSLVVSPWPCGFLCRGSGHHIISCIRFSPTVAFIHSLTCSLLLFLPCFSFTRLHRTFSLPSFRQSLSPSLLLEHNRPHARVERMGGREGWKGEEGNEEARLLTVE